MTFQRQACWICAGATQLVCCLMLLTAAPFHVVGNDEGTSEVAALYSLRQALIDPSQVLESWGRLCSTPCNWFRVTCNAENSVIRIDLGNADLSGTLVPQLGLLSNLQYLEMYSNNLTGSIPDSLGNLTQLVSLDLYQNSFVGSIPASLGDLSQLVILRFNINDLSGSIPESLTGLDNLESLDLSYNDLVGGIPVTGVFARFSFSSFEGNPGLQNSTSLAPTPAPSPAPFAPLSYSGV